MASNFKKLTYSIVVLLLLLVCYSVCYSQQVSRIVNYNAEYTPFGDGIQKEYAFPKNVDPDKHFQIVFTFDLTPEQIEADVTGTMTFDQENGTIQLRGKDGNLQSKGGLTLKGVVKIAFVIESVPYLTLDPTLLVAVFAINQLVDFPLPVKNEVVVVEPGGLDLSQLLSELIPIGSLTVNPYQTWDESEPFSTLLLDDDVVVRGGIRKLVRAELTAVEVAQLIVTALTAIPPSLSKPAATIVEKGIGNAAISANLGFLSTATLSGESITVNGVKITRENQTIKAPGLDLSQNSYTVNSSYNENFTYKLDLAATSDVTLEFNPLGIPIWNYEKVIGELPITPIVSEQEVDLNFTSNQTTFPIAQESTVPTVQAPVPQGAIPIESLSDNGSGSKVNVAQYFSSSNSLTYEVSTNPSGIVTASVSGSQVTITPISAGVTTVIVTARDTVNTNLTATQTISVVVNQTSAIVHPPNNDPTFPLPDSNPRAEGLREGVSVIIQNVPLTSAGLNLRSNPWLGDNQIRKLYDGATGIITDGPEKNDNFTWWKIEWDQVDIEAWSVEYFEGDQLLFRRPLDLEIRDFDVRDSEVSIGERIELEVQVRNNGPGESAATEVLFYYHPGSKNYDLEDLSKETDLRIPGTGKLSVPSLQESRSKTLTLWVDAPPVPDRYYYGAFLPKNWHDTDYQGDITPRMISNNLASEQRVTVNGRPDYIVESISVSKTTLDPGESFTLRATVRNQGEGEPTSSADLDYYRSSDARISSSDTWVGDDSVSRLDADETGRESISLNAPSSPGVYYYGACVSDVDNESNSNNNCSAAVAITVQAPDPEEPAVPNLVVETPTTSTTTLGPGESFTLNATVRNKGTANSSATTFRWYRSSNSYISENDTEIGSANINSLSADGTVTQEISLTAPMAAGTYYYGGCVESSTDESDTTDNCSSAITITIQNRAPTTVGAIASQTLSVEDPHIRLDVSPYFSDPNNTSLTYTAISSDTSVVSAEAAGVSGSNLTIRPIAEGSATITVTASDGELTATQTLSVTVNPIPVTISESPDLVVSLSSNNSFVEPNASINLDATVRNQGTADASNSTTLRYYLSSDAVISSDDQEIGTDSVRSLKNGNSDEEDHGVRAPNTPGTYYYYACVDTVTGEDETENNCSNIIIINVRGSDLIIDTVSVDLLGQTGGINPNGSFKLNANVKNQGTGDASTATLRYYISADQTLSTVDDSEVQIGSTSALSSGASSNVQSATIQSTYISGVFYCFVCVDGLTNETDTNNNCSDAIRITVRNVAPRAQGTIAAQTLNIGTSLPINVSVYFADDNKDTLTFTSNSSNTSVATASRTGSQITITPVSTGNATITVTAKDSTLTATQTFNVSVVDPNSAPTAVSTISARTLTAGGTAEQVDVSSNFNDPDGDDLTYTVNSSNNSVATASNSGSQVTITPVSTGNATITVTASDGKLSVTQNISISVNAAVSGVDWMPDANLRAAVRSALNLQASTLTQEALRGLSRLRTRNSQIANIIGLEHATNLRELTLDQNQISDITPLQDLTGLQELRLWKNQISDITPLSALLNLHTLDLSDNQISNLTPLKNLTNLGLLSLSNNQISDITPLKNLARLWLLNLSNNQISDITPLTNLTRLSTVEEGHNKVLKLSNNQISDITPLKNLTALGELYLSNNQISNVAPLENLSKLFKLSLTGNSITDNAPLRRLKSKNPNLQIDIDIGAVPIANRAPVTVRVISAQTLTVGDTSLKIDLSSKFHDPDNDTLVYTASSSDTNIVSVSVSEPEAQATITSVAAGSATITITASDGKLSVTQNISISVNAAVPVVEWMPDAKLRTTVRRALGLQEGEALTKQAMSDLTFLSYSPDRFDLLLINSPQITELTGLEYATGLTYLDLSDNSISDISAVSGLTSLTSLSLSDNSISDISAVSGLTSLTWLGMSRNSISDISAISGLTSLTGLSLTNNSISDISAVSGLTSLTGLSLTNNSISDISAVSGLTLLTHLYLPGNSISDISAVSGLTSLTALTLGKNSISDISVLSGLTSLTWLELENNSISDVSPLEDLKELIGIFLEGNPITDYAPIRSLKTKKPLAKNPHLQLDIDLNNNIPTFTEGDSTTRTVAENTASGENIGTAVSATDADTDDTLTYSLSGTDAESFSIVSTSGQLQTSAALDYETKTSYSVTIRVYDGNSAADFIDVTINVTDDPNAAPSAQANPTETILLSNYPNPFNPETWIPYQLAKSAEVTLTIYNVKGVVVRQLALGHRAAGVYYSRNRAAHWDGRNNIGEKVSTGLYFIKFRAGDYTATRKMLIRK